jgi:soluble lytic murein transglycosylase
VEVVFFRADALHDRLDLDAALASYGRLREMAPALNLAGLARMRMAQIHLGRGDSTRAVEVFRGYLADFPEGRRWEEAAYWAGRLLLALGDSTGSVLLEDVLGRSPLSYYAVLASEALGRVYRPPGMAEGDLPPVPTWMSAELHTVDLLAAAGLEEGRQVQTERLTRRALDGPADAAVRLAHELVDRDLTLDGINLGWDLRERGMDWSRALLEVLYPFPHREMVYRAAGARGLDPILVASIIRQESAFAPAIVSRAGAVGLMQVMPVTGSQLAATEGPRDFDPESLVTPEINLHLGTRYLLDLLERYEGLPFVLAAYNAGPSRADAWSSFPEADDPDRFTERIPFAETRDYVKQIGRNLALYGALYGGPPAS